MNKEERPHYLLDQKGNIYSISWIKTRAKNFRTGESYWRIEGSARFLLSDLKPKEGETKQ